MQLRYLTRRPAGLQLAPGRVQTAVSAAARNARGPEPGKGEGQQGPDCPSCRRSSKRWVEDTLSP